MRINADRLRLEVRRSRRPFLIYIALVVAGVGATYGILRNQTFLRPWESYYEVRAAVDDAKGIVPGKQEVRIAGVKVGVVTGSELVDGQPVLTLSLEEEYAPIHRDASVAMRPVTPLQDMYVTLDRGGEKAGEAPEDFVIPQEQNLTPVDVSRVLQTFDAETRDRLSALLDQMGPALQDNGAQLRAAFVRAAPFLDAAKDVGDALDGRRASLSRLVSNLGRLTDTLADHDEALTELVVNGEGTLGELARRDEPLAQTIGELPRMLGALDGAMSTLGATRTDLEPALVALRPAARALVPGLAALRELGAEARPAFAALRTPIKELRPMARVLRPTAGALAEALEGLGTQAPSLDRFTTQVVPCREQLRQFFSHTPSVGKFGNAFSAYPRGDVSVDVGTLGARSANGLKRSPSCTDVTDGGR